MEDFEPSKTNAAVCVQLVAVQLVGRQTVSIGEQTSSGSTVSKGSNS